MPTFSKNEVKKKINQHYKEEHNNLFFSASCSSSSIRSDILQVSQLPSLIKKNSRQLLIADSLLSIDLYIWLQDLRLLSDPPS